MADDRLLRGFRAFDAEVAPDPAFAERLFAELSGELGFGGAGAPARVPVAVRVRRALRLDWRPLPPATMRLVYVVASAALLLAALAGAAFVASQLAHRSPLEIVRLSQAAVKDPPPFVLVYRNATGQEVTFAYDGNGTWRGNEPDGSYMLWDGQRIGLYNAQGKTWGAGEEPVTSPPFIPLMDTWGWASTSVPGALGQVTPIDCADAEWVEEATVAGRATDRIRCPSWYGTEVWIDRESHLVLKYVAGPDAPGWTGEMPPDVVMRGIEAVSLDLSPPNAAAFSWDGPVGAFDESNPPPSTVLAVGAPVPTLTATTVDGEVLSLPKPGRPAAVLFSANWARGRYGRMYDAFSAAAAAHPGVDTAIVMNAMAGTVAGYRSLHPTSVPLVGDWDTALWQTWGISALGTLVLVDGEGNAAAMRYDKVSADGLDRLFGALERGEAPPDVPAVTPAPTAASSFVPLPEDAVTEIPIGDPVPAWAGRLLDGTTLESSALLGQPYVLTNFAASTCEDCPVDHQLESFGAASGALDERAEFVLVGNGEFEAGATDRLMDRLGIATPVVMDWDGAVGDALKWIIMGTIVVDDEGRLVAVFEQFPGEAEIAAVLDQLETTATPAP